MIATDAPWTSSPPHEQESTVVAVDERAEERRREIRRGLCGNAEDREQARVGRLQESPRYCYVEKCVAHRGDRGGSRKQPEGSHEMIPRVWSRIRSRTLWMRDRARFDW